MSKKYNIYNSDLKYKKLRNIDPSKINWESEEQERIYYEENTDSLDYRLKECIEKNGGEYLDLSHMDLECIPNISNDIISKIKYLFLNNNNICNTYGLNKYSNIEVLDIENNNINELVNIPKNITELNCKSNKLKNIPYMKYLEKLECSNNMIEKIETYEKLEILSCSNNKIKSLPPSKNLRKIVCENNLIETIENYPKLEYLNCGFNNIEKIINCPNVIDILCRNNKLTDLPIDLPKLKYLEMYCNIISKLYFYPNMKELYCDTRGINHMSKNYKVKKSDIYSNNKCYIIFE